jgi:hypothetical protein
MIDHRDNGRHKEFSPTSEIHQLPTESYANGGEETCIEPKSAVGKRQPHFQRMFGSHDWQVRSSDRYADGILIRFACSRCNADAIAIVVSNSDNRDM